MNLITRLFALCVSGLGNKHCVWSVTGVLGDTALTPVVFLLCNQFVSVCACVWGGSSPVNSFLYSGDIRYSVLTCDNIYCVFTNKQKVKCKLVLKSFLDLSLVQSCPLVLKQTSIKQFLRSVSNVIISLSFPPNVISSQSRGRVLIVSV